jgi:hypothetical protein
MDRSRTSGTTARVVDAPRRDEMDEEQGKITDVIRDLLDRVGDLERRVQALENSGGAIALPGPQVSDAPAAG